MKSLTRLLAVSVFALIASPVFAGIPVQMWHCEVFDEASEDDVLNAIEEWLKSVRKVPGGEGLKAQALFPVVVASEGDFDVWITLTTDSFEAWGKFWDNYPDSDAGELEDTHGKIFVCPDSVLFEAIEPDSD